jgi:hypothetical protein
VEGHEKSHAATTPDLPFAPTQQARLSESTKPQSL